MLSENKFSKYLLYAIGEILLVVVGILIALQVNNWNEARKQGQLEIRILKEMKDNLLNDLKDIEYNIKEDTETLISNQLILEHMENGIPYNDSLSTHFGKLQRTAVLVANTSAFENLKSLGINLIRNDSLRRRITDLYSARYAYIKAVHLGTTSRIIWEKLNPILLENLTSKVVLEDATPVDYESLKKNIPFKEALRWHISIKEFIIDLYKDTAQGIRDIVELIDQEVNTEP